MVTLNKGAQKMKAYEIYTKNPTTGQLGWDIKFVWSTPDMIKLYPDFDCIISVNDCQPDEVWPPA
jgi:hypothetical protein